MKFLESVARQICNAKHDALYRIEVIFPAVRPISPFLQALSAQLGKASLAPACYALDEWAYRRSGLRRGNRLDLIALLHQAYLHVTSQDGSEPDPTEQFLSWASGLLGDFEEVDAYVLPTEAQPHPAEQVYRYLHQQRAVEIWNPSGEESTPVELDYLRFYDLIYPTYLEFRRLLSVQGIDYPSGALRTLLESINSPEHRPQWPDAIYLVGFDHITPLIIKLIQELQGVTTVHWIADSDRYYLDNPVHLAGHWLRQLPSSPPFVQTKPSTSPLAEALPVLNQCSCAGNMEQIDAGIQQIQSWMQEGVQPAQIGWVMGDSTQVWPLLMQWNLPDVGLHLGLALDLRWTSSYSWAMAALEIYQTLCFKGKVSATDWNEWIHNPLWSHLNLITAKQDPETAPRKLTFLYAKDLRSYQVHGISIIPDKLDDATLSYLHLAELANTLGESGAFGIAPMEQHALRSLSTLIHQIAARILSAQNPWAVWRKMWAMHLGSAALNPRGTTTDGIRIMSLADTLAMDFDYLLFSGLNEGIMPRPGRYRGMLSFDLRRHFGLPEPWADEARQAYAFYRLLQHCSQAQLLYAQSGADGKVTEKSRFLQQLDLEYHGSMKTQLRDLPVSIPPAVDDSISIPKTEAVLNLIRHKFISNNLSPSSLSIYLKCPLRFWFASIRDLRAPDQIEEQLNPGQIGTLFHLTLENLFKPLEGSDLTADQWADLSQQIPEALDKACQDDDFKSYSFDQGVNVLVKRMGLQFLKNYFQSESMRSHHERIHLHGQELKFEAKLEVDGLDLAWKGRLDRLESNAGRIRIVDFKSGSMTRSSKELDLESLETVLDGEHDKAFQLLCYGWMAHANPRPMRRDKTLLDDPITFPLELGIVPLQQAAGGSMLLKVGGQTLIDHPTITAFEDILRGVIREILDPQQPILQTEEESRCKYCDFNRICKRVPED